MLLSNSIISRQTLSKGVNPIKTYSDRLLMHLYVLALSFSLALLICGCASQSSSVRGPDKRTDVTFKKIAVVPFQLVTASDPSSNTVRCPICGTMARSCASPNDAAKTVEDLFLERLKTHKELTTIPQDDTSGIFRMLQSESFKEKPTDILLKVGTALNADAVVAGYVYCYREREGTAFSVRKPASVSFELSVVRSSDGSVVWSSFFDKTQASLMENVLQISSFIKGGWKWNTARELTEQGIDKAMETFPISR